MPLNSEQQSNSGKLLVNRYLRAVRYPGFVGARVQAGALRPSHEAGVGDCALLDFSTGLFAVADGSDRDPSASRRFMIMFARMVKSIVHPLALASASASAGRSRTASETSDIKKALSEESERLLCSLPFGTGCTFTGILLLKTAGEITSIVMHTGDSLLISCDISNSEACQFTQDNFWLVGRSRRFFQIETLPVRGSTRLLLATDGLRGLPFPAGSAGADMNKFILDLFKNCSPDEIPDNILNQAGPPAAGRDDTLIISLNPSAFAYLPQCLMLGGTGIHEEKLYREERDRGSLDDEYAPVRSSGETLTI